MTDTPDLAAIAASLGKRERCVLVKLDAGEKIDGRSRSIEFLLWSTQLAFKDWGDLNSPYRITPLGRAVASVLQEKA